MISRLSQLLASLLVLFGSSLAFTTTTQTRASFSLRSKQLTPLFALQQPSDTKQETRLFQSSEAKARPFSDLTQQEKSEPQEPLDGSIFSNSSDLTKQEIDDNQKLLDAVVFVNTSVLLFVGSAVIYSLFHVNIEALLALWEYDLGPHAPEITKIGVAMELMSRLPMDWIHSYEELVPTSPIFYKACTSGVAYALGDFISQVYQGKTLNTLDLPRSLRSGAAGFIGHGPLCHYWLTFMETYLDFNGAWWATGIKVTADLTVWSIFLNAAYSMIIGTLAFRNPKDVFADVKVTLWPALRSAWRFWPFVHTISFSHAVPMDLKLLWVDVMEVVWVTILSKVANEDKVARMKENPELHAQDVSKSIPEVDPSLEIELAREAELSGDNHPKLTFELPQKVLAACWPLIAMWPVLYGSYQLERYLGLEV